MLFASLDEITKRSLIDNGLPIHFYVEHLSYAAACIRELSIDSLRIVRTARLPINDYHAVDLPDDFVDDVSCGIPVGQFIMPITKKNSITDLRNRNTTTGEYEDYQGVTSETSQSGLFLNPGWLWFWNVNDFGEPTGRQFGANGGSTLNGYKVVKERRQIQLTESFTGAEIVLVYISDGQSADNATNIDMQAFSCVQSYIGWKTSPNRHIKDSPEARTFYNEKRILRARMNDMTVVDLRQVLYNSYSATLKN